MSEIDLVAFQCNVCGAAREVERAELVREAATCDCGSSVRTRSIVHLLSMALFGSSLVLTQFPEDKTIRGVGLSDWLGYALPLQHKLDYSNTWFHQEPRLDITDIPPEWEGTLDFLISTEVFEHVAPPVQRAFDGARRLLKPGGVLVLTVPYDHLAPASLEHFPQLYEFHLVEEAERRRLYNVRRDGTTEVFDDLIFHGGPGSTLEMRLFSLPAILKHCLDAGFGQVREAGEDVPDRGIIWAKPWSRPVIATA